MTRRDSHPTAARELKPKLDGSFQTLVAEEHKLYERWNAVNMFGAGVTVYAVLYTVATWVGTAQHERSGCQQGQRVRP